MIILISGPSHTGKTFLAQKILEKYKIPYLSADHLKMGLIRSGNTSLTPMDSDAELTGYLWPIIREIVKTAIENRQNLTIEGCYIPIGWEKDFCEGYLKDIRHIRLIMSEDYVRIHFDDVKKYASVIESRLDDGYCTLEAVLDDNLRELRECEKEGADFLYIDKEYFTESEAFNALGLPDLE